MGTGTWWIWAGSYVLRHMHNLILLTAAHWNRLISKKRFHNWGSIHLSIVSVHLWKLMIQPISFGVWSNLNPQSVVYICMYTYMYTHTHKRVHTYTHNIYGNAHIVVSCFEGPYGKFAHVHTPCSHSWIWRVTDSFENKLMSDVTHIISAYIRRVPHDIYIYTYYEYTSYVYVRVCESVYMYTCIYVYVYIYICMLIHAAQQGRIARDTSRSRRHINWQRAANVDAEWARISGHLLPRRACGGHRRVFSRVPHQSGGVWACVQGSTATPLRTGQWFHVCGCQETECRQHAGPCWVPPGGPGAGSVQTRECVGLDWLLCGP